jgi:hypothetical protein
MLHMSKNSAKNDTNKYGQTKKEEEEISSEGLINMFNVNKKKSF